MRAPKVGDYIITNKLIGYGKFDDMYNIGQIVKTEYEFYFVKIFSDQKFTKGYENLILKMIHINCWSEDLEELKLKLVTNKYNL